MDRLTATKELLRTCPICGGRRGEILHTQHFAVFDDYPLPSVYDIVECMACGMVFADTPATQADYDKFYADCSIYADANVAAGGGAADWDARRLTVSAEIISGALPSAVARILDVGCANGGLLQALKNSGFHNVYGVDPSPACVGNTRAKGIEACRGELSRLPAEIGQFDLVILASVLEHVLDLKSAIAALASVCSPDGKIFLEVPDAAAYVDHLYAPFQDFNTEHINHFSPAALDNLLGQFGFTRCLTERILMEGASNFQFPSLEVVYRRTGGPVSQSGWRRDADFRGRIEAYIGSSRALMARLNEQIETALASSKEVILWGAGQLAMKLLCDTALRDARLVACVDGNSIHRGKKLRGVPILPPELAPSGDTPILISTLLHADEIRLRIRGLGLRNPVIALRV